MERQGRWRVGVGGGGGIVSTHQKQHNKNWDIAYYSHALPHLCGTMATNDLFKRVRLQEIFLQEKHDSNAVVSMRVAVTKAKLHAKNTATRV